MTKNAFTILALVMAARTPSLAQTGPAADQADSIVLERSACYGTCPAYRLSVRRSGIVTFQSRNRGDPTTARDSIAPQAFAQLVAVANRDRVFELPKVIANDRSLCPDHATDHETVSVSFFSGERAQGIVDYHGCFLRSDHTTASPLQTLRLFEAAIDSVTDARRWIRPNRIR